MSIYVRSGIVLPREYETEPFYNKIKKKLTRTVPAYQYSHVITNKFYLESEKTLVIPRYFPLHKYTKLNIKDKRHEGEIIDIEHNITPRDITQENAIKHMLSNECATMQLAPGVGKTIISIYAIAERKRKTIVFVHLDNLVDQWKQRLLTFTNLKENNISRLKSATFKTDLQTSVIITTVQTFTSLLKRFRVEFLIELNKANIGVFIADEVHTTVGAPTFSECSIHIPSKYTYGLSATPKRSDGNEDIIYYHLGDVYRDEDTAGTLKPKVLAILLDYKIDQPRRYRYLYWDGYFQRARYLNLMKKSEPFLYASKRLLERLKTDRNILFVAERIKLIEELYKWLDHPSKSMFCGSADLSAIQKQITLATPGKCRDGIDAPHKDCLIMSSPIGNIEQLAGRILREKPGKKKPLIVDLVDYGCTQISNTFRGRLKYYQDRNWEIDYMLCKNNLLYNVDLQKAMKIIKEKQ